eukprot:GILI01054116.1.p1 GENE.GILI01054116.1~~GILI01054116.1.p1  ORF type:complete len:108 (+),score=24.16 GILI01054116.1:41-325(+)
MIQAMVETANPRQELQVATKLLGRWEKDFFWVSDMYTANNDPTQDGIFITTSYDATSHFESATEEVISLYQKITSEELNLTISAEPDDLKDPQE